MTGVLGRVVGTSSSLGHALQLLFLLLGHIKAHHVHDKFGSAFSKLSYQRAGIAGAGLLAIGNKNDGGLPFDGLEFFRSLFNRQGDGGHALGADGLDLAYKNILILWSQGNQFLHVIAVALLAVAIGYEAHPDICGQVFDKTGHDLLGDVDFGLVFYLPPHGTGGVQDEEDV